MRDDNVTDVVIKCSDIITLDQYLRSLSIELSCEFFENMPVQFVSNTKKSTIHKLMSINNNKNLCKRKDVSENKREKVVEKERLRKKKETIRGNTSEKRNRTGKDESI